MYFPIFQLIMAEGEVFIINVFFFNFRCYFIHVMNISKRTDTIQIQQNTPTSFICSLKKKIDLLKQEIVENAKATFCFILIFPILLLLRILLTSFSFYFFHLLFFFFLAHAFYYIFFLPL